MASTMEAVPIGLDPSLVVLTLAFDVIVADGVLFSPSTTHYFLNSDLSTWSIIPMSGSSSMPAKIKTIQPLYDFIESTYPIPSVPISGDIYIVYSNINVNVGTVGTTISLAVSSISLIQTGENDVLGEIFTFERIDSPSARVEKTREVFTGDSDLDIYEGTLYKADGTTPTETWYRKGVTEAVPILELMGSETMRMNANTMRVFSGDVYGYLNYLSVITIYGRSGKFGVTKYSYDTKNNIISLEVKQMFADELTDLEVTPTFDLGNVVEPTIRG